jgi:hypothetical protein
MKINKWTFGKKSKFQVGDLVFWTENHLKKSGVIENLLLKEMGGREVVFATVFEFSQSEKHDVLCLSLKKIHKSEVNEVEN